MRFPEEESEDVTMSKRPVHQIRLGRIRAAIWENQSKNGTRYNVTISRLYREEDEWRDSSSFGRDDLLLVAKVADRAHGWIFEQSQSRSENPDEGF